MIAIRYRVKLEEPVLVTSLQGDPNSAVAFSYLPGSVLRGALIGRLLKTSVIHDPVTRRRFFENSTCFLNAYCVWQDQRMLPTPLSWMKQSDLALDELLDAPTDSQAKRKRIQAAFHLRDGEKVHLHTPDRHIAIHIERSRIGVPQGDEGEVYRYESLAEGECFEGVILCDHKIDADYFQKQLESSFTLWLGGARTAGYGRTQWKIEKREDSWLEHSFDQGRGQWVIEFLSPALLRDENGQYAADESTILRHLGIQQAIKSRIDSEMIGGFNRKWGLPLPQTLAVKAGSVLLLGETSGVDAVAREQSGIGERRMDGFGRIAIYRQYADTFAIQSKPEDKSGQLSTVSQTKQDMKSPVSALNAADQATVSLVRDRIRRESQRQMTEERANSPQYKIKNPPRHTQLSALREAAARGLRSQTASVRPVLDFLNSTDERYFSRAQFEEARINGKPLMGWVRGVLDGKLEQEITQFGDQVDVTAALRLIDAVAARSVRAVEKSKR